MGKLKIIGSFYRTERTSTVNSGKRGRYAFLIVILCIVAFAISLITTHFQTQNSLNRSFASVERGFSSIMKGYRHSFALLEKLLVEEIRNEPNPDDIEAFLKSQDSVLAKIEGADFDGVYMYYQNRYLYSWSTPQSVYEDSGYDATTRPWYLGAVEADGEIFFSVPYPSYANDYMLATLSRLQPDGQTVIAYDIKLAEIAKYVDLLDVFDNSVTFICDNNGNILGSTEHLYQGGNYTKTREQLDADVAAANEQRTAAETDDEINKADKRVQSTNAIREFCLDRSNHLEELVDRQQRCNTT